MRDLVASAGGPLHPTENRTAWLYRIADTAGLHFRVVRAAWHGEQLSAETARKLKAAAERREHENDRDYHAIAGDLERIARALRTADAELCSPEIDALWDLARQVRGLTRRT